MGTQTHGRKKASATPPAHAKVVAAGVQLLHATLSVQERADQGAAALRETPMSLWSLARLVHQQAIADNGGKPITYRRNGKTLTIGIEPTRKTISDVEKRLRYALVAGGYDVDTLCPPTEKSVKAKAAAKGAVEKRKAKATAKRSAQGTNETTKPATPAKAEPTKPATPAKAEPTNPTTADAARAADAIVKWAAQATPKDVAGIEPSTLANLAASLKRASEHILSLSKRVPAKK